MVFQVFATVVEEYSRFYIKLTSSVIQIGSKSTDLTTENALTESIMEHGENSMGDDRFNNETSQLTTENALTETIMEHGENSTFVGDGKVNSGISKHMSSSCSEYSQASFEYPLRSTLTCLTILTARSIQP